jgi:hypothetical protein
MATFWLPNGEVFWLLYLTCPTFDFVAGDIQRVRDEMREPGNVTIGDLDMESAHCPPRRPQGSMRAGCGYSLMRR